MESLSAAYAASSSSSSGDIINNQHTLETHKWFSRALQMARSKMISKMEEKEKESRRNNLMWSIKILALMFLVILILYQKKFDATLLVNMLTFMLHLGNVYYIYMLPIVIDENAVDRENGYLYMRFTRPGIFYKNTHYIFNGTKRRLEKALNQLRKEAEEYRIENKDSRADHDQLMDSPLDTFCTATCSCNDLINEYYCSHWECYSYDSYNELMDAITKINETRTSFPNEFIHL
jgi:hypothetical protein